MREIPITDIGPVRIGQVEDTKAGTGCTVFLSGEGMRTGVDIRGGGPAARESQLLDPIMMVQEVHAAVISGGSAYGLAAADGVMR